MKFGAGDIVKKKYSKEEKSKREYYVVILPPDETKNANTCILKQIYPLEPLMKNYEIHIKNLELIAYDNSASQKHILTLLISQRQSLGWFNNDTLHRFLKGRVGTETIPNDKDVVLKNQSSLIDNRIKYNESDVVEYNKLTTIDECLDSINHLNDLILNFKDDTEQLKQYRNYKAVVKRRLKRLIEIQNRKKKQ